MKLKIYAAALVGAFVAGICGIFFLPPMPEQSMNPAEINDIVATLAADFEQLGTENYTLPGQLNYAVIDHTGNLRAATQHGLSENVYAAVRHKDTMVDISQDGKVLGKAIFWNDAEAGWREYRSNLQMVLILILTVTTGIAAVLLLIAYKNILRPFRRMRHFAGRVAAGELDIPLEMDKQGAFGAFTESFDLMREELQRARENERAAEQSKQEMVASLSHDIQTPVASIQAVAELMELTANESQCGKLRAIQQKAGQIQTLVAEMFHTALEELNSLSVKPVVLPSSKLGEMIEKADYQDKVQIAGIPGCLLQADPSRLAQIIDNILANSYKYANTAIDISAWMDEEGLIILLRDYGPGADPEELPLLCSKYYRGKGAAGKSGFGLGLHIARSLIERMGGRLECENAWPGLTVKLWLRFDG